MPSILVALALPSAAAELSLDRALSLALTGPAAARAGLQLDLASADVAIARSAYDPTIAASGSASSSVSAGFFVGVPTSSRSTTTAAEVSLQQTAPTGTTVAVTGSLQGEDTTSSSSLAGDQTQRFWMGSASLSVTQDLLAPLRASAERIALRQSGERLEQAQVTQVQAVQAALTGAAEAWWTWWAATDAAEVAGARLAFARQLEERTRAWRDVGQIAQLELDRVTADRLAAERDALQADADVRRTAYDLAVRIGQPLDAGWVPAGSGRAWTVDTVAPADEIVSDAVQRNLDLAVTRLRSEAAGSALGDARDTRLPRMDLTGSAGVASLSDTASEAVQALWGPDGFPRLTLALDVALPVGGRAARAQVGAAAAEQASIASSLAQDTAQVEADTRATLDQIATAQRSFELATAQLEVARSTERGERARVDEGVRRLDELLDATGARVQAEAAVRTAQIDLARAEMRLAELRSRLLEVGDAA